MINKEDFCKVIESLRVQVVKDKEKSFILNDLFKTDTVFNWDNDELFKSILFLLHQYFPRDKNGFCEIEHYCFFIEFGKYENKELFSSEDLYDKLITNIKN